MWRPPVILPAPCGWQIAPAESSDTLYNVLCPGKRPLGGPTVLLTVQLGQLQHRHVAEWTHFPYLQPLNKAPGEGDSAGGERSGLCTVGLRPPGFCSDRQGLLGRGGP